MPSTGNKLLDFFVFIIVIVVALIVLFRVLDILDDESDSDGAFIDQFITETYG
jgi:hypothetical protein